MCLNSTSFLYFPLKLCLNLSDFAMVFWMAHLFVPRAPLQGHANALRKPPAVGAAAEGMEHARGGTLCSAGGDTYGDLGSGWG